MSKKTTTETGKFVYVATIPGIFGYGLQAFGATPHAATKLLHGIWRKWSKNYEWGKPWGETLEYFDATLVRVNFVDGEADYEGGVGERIEFPHV